jgi:transposase
LKQEFETYNQLQDKIEKYDQEIKTMLDENIDSDNNKKQYYIDKKTRKRINKNTPKSIDLNLLGYQYFEGVDLFKIEGLSHATLLAIISEVGLEGIKKFPTAKHFAS